ncbi:MAG TPA: putative protein N(5)-glutamine methyltransferase [Micromonosporaceae bacterium]|jgi:release factor glutamine methyltransferase
MSRLEPVEPTIVARLRAVGCVFATDEARLLVSATSDPSELEAMVERRVAGLPLEHVLGWVEFFGLRLFVDPGVFVPRRRTEFLVRQASALIGSGALAVDLCCGCGALGAALASVRPGIELYASDLEPAAVECARRNLVPIGGRVYAGDLFAALPSMLRGRINVLMANVPYVPTDQVALMPPEARDHEPRVALDGGSDGLDVARRVAAGAVDWLAPGGHLLFEVGRRQAPAALATVSSYGLSARLAYDDEFEANVVIAGRSEL